MEPSELRELLNTVQNIVVIGCSSNPYRTSYHISEYMKSAGFNIIPVNPNEKEVLGQKCYPSIKDIPDTVQVGMVDIFRNKKYTLDMVQEIVEWSERTGQKPVIWTQLDVSSDEAEKLAKEKGFTYIKNRCLMVAHRLASNE